MTADRLREAIEMAFEFYSRDDRRPVEVTHERVGDLHTYHASTDGAVASVSIRDGDLKYPLIVKHRMKALINTIGMERLYCSA